MRKILILALTLTACVTSSGVLPYGPDTYTISTRSYYRTNAAARAAALKKASAFCNNIDKVMMPDMERTRRSNVGEWGLPGTDLNFMCLDPNDPRLKSPQMRPEPNIVIENRR